MVPIYWDNAWIDFELFNRTTGAIKDRQLLDRLMLGADGIVRTDYIRLVNLASGLVISGTGNSAAQSSKDSVYSQQWVLETVAGYVRIKNRATGLFLDDTGASADNTNDNQKWVEEFNKNYIKFKNKATGLYLDGLGNTGNGSVLGYEENSASKNQQWAISSIIDEPALPNGIDAPALPNGIDVQIIESNIELYPNPFSSAITLNVSYPDKVVKIVICDFMGRQVDLIDKSAISSSLVLGSDLKEGVYLVQIYGKNWTKSLKIVKN